MDTPSKCNLENYRCSVGRSFKLEGKVFLATNAFAEAMYAADRRNVTSANRLPELLAMETRRNIAMGAWHKAPGNSDWGKSSRLRPYLKTKDSGMPEPGVGSLGDEHQDSLNRAQLA
jgi:hypothetical protein